MPYELSVILHDAHVPFHDLSAIHAAIETIHFLKPDNLIILGDWYDCYQISKFTKNPTRAMEFQADLDAGAELLSAAGRHVRNKKFQSGNHEDRIRKWSWDHPETASLKALAPTELFKLDELGFEYYPYDTPVPFSPFFTLTHGNIVRKFAGYTAKAMLEMYNTSGYSGHTHRAGMFHRTTPGLGKQTWAEGGCLCNLEPEYLHVADWQQGFGLIYSEGSRHYVHLVPVTDGQAFLPAHMKCPEVPQEDCIPELI